MGLAWLRVRGFAWLRAASQAPRAAWRVFAPGFASLACGFARARLGGLRAHSVRPESGPLCLQRESTHVGAEEGMNSF